MIVVVVAVVMVLCSSSSSIDDSRTKKPARENAKAGIGFGAKKNIYYYYGLALLLLLLLLVLKSAQLFGLHCQGQSTGFVSPFFSLLSFILIFSFSRPRQVCCRSRARLFYLAPTTPPSSPLYPNGFGRRGRHGTEDTRK